MLELCFTPLGWVWLNASHEPASPCFHDVLAARVWYGAYLRKQRGHDNG